MSLLKCSHCHQPVSATHKVCPHCGRSLSLLAELKSQVENNRMWQVLLVIFAVLLLGVGWFVRMDSGARWPLYIVIVLVAPLVPWVLQLAYKSASPLKEAEKDSTDERP